MTISLSTEGCEGTEAGEGCEAGEEYTPQFDKTDYTYTYHYTYKYTYDNKKLF